MKLLHRRPLDHGKEGEVKSESQQPSNKQANWVVEVFSDEDSEISQSNMEP